MDCVHSEPQPAREPHTGGAFARRVEFERGENLERVSDTENVDLCVCGVCGEERERKMREKDEAGEMRQRQT